MGFERSHFPEAEIYYRRAISIPIYPSISEDEQSFVIDVIKSDTSKKFEMNKGFQNLF